jgi:hypothetical protein
MEVEAMTSLQTELARIVEAEREHERRRATLRPQRRRRTRSSRRVAGAIAAILGVARKGSRSARAPYPLER